MKHIKESNIKFVKWSEVEGWEKPKVWVELDKMDPSVRNQVEKVYDILAHYGLAVLDMQPGDNFLSKGGFQLGNEKNKTEWRVTLGQFYSRRSLGKEWGVETIEEWDAENGKDNINRDDFLEDIEKLGTIKPIPWTRQKLEFSVFIDNYKPSEPDVKALVVITAVKYMSHLITSFGKDIIEGKITSRDYMYELMENVEYGFTKFLDKSGEKITNKNIDRIPTICRRLWKDSKFFRELRDYLGPRVANEMLLEITKSFKQQ